MNSKLVKGAGHHRGLEHVISGKGDNVKKTKNDL